MQTIGGGPNSGSTGDRSTTTVSNVKTMTLTAPANAVSGNFLLATITGQGTSVTSASNICPASTTSGWTIVDKKYVAGTLIQATYSGFAGSISSYAFNFLTSAASCTGAAGSLSLSASAVVLRYTNVSAAKSTDVVPTANTGAPTSTSWSGSAPTTTWANGSYSSTIASTDWNTDYASISTGCVATDSSTCNDTVVPAGSITGFTFNLGTATPNKTTYLVTLLVNGAATTPTMSCTVAAKGGTSCTSTGGPVSVNAGATVELSVVEGNGGGKDDTSTATISTTETTSSSVTQYVSVSTACASTSATTCNVSTTPSPGGTLFSGGLTFATAVPTGDTFTVTLFKNGATTTTNCTIAAGASTCSLPSGLAVATGATLELQVTRTAGSTGFSTTATTAAVIASGVTTLTAPAVTTTQPDDQVVYLFGTGSTSFLPTAPPVTIASGSTATGADDTVQTTVGTAAAETETTPTVDDWIAQTISLEASLPTSITITPPSGYAAGDLLLVTIGLQGSGVAACSPSTSTWSSIATTSNPAGTTKLTQETFYTTSGSPGYTFNFQTLCPTGTAVAAGASWVATYFTGVNAANPVDASSSSAGGTTSPLTTQSVATNYANDELVGLFATNATSITVGGTGTGSVNSTFGSSGINTLLKGVPGTYSPTTSLSSPTAANWLEQTVALRPALSSSFTVTPPTDYSGNSGDMLLVSVAVQALSSGGVICAPQDGTWNALAPISSSGGSAQTAVTQEMFWTSSSTASSDVFSFKTSCSGSTTASGEANAIATTYDGVDPATPPTVTAAGSTGSTLTPTSNTTLSADEEVVNFFATSGAFGTVTPGTNPSQTLVKQTSPSSAWVNVAETAGVQQTAGSQAAAPAQASATSTGSASWTAETVDLTPLLSSSIVVTPPTNYVGGGGDLLLVSIEAQNLGSGSICAPDSTWTAVPISATPTTYTTTSGALTQETFYTTVSEATSDTFSFYSKAGCAGAPLTLGASAVAVMYTGVNTATPIDGSATVPASSVTSSSPLAPAAVTTHAANEEVVTMFGSAAPTLTGPTLVTAGNYLAPSAGVNNAAVASAGAYTPAQATSSPTAEPWTAETIALTPLANDGITIARPATPTSDDFILVTVTTSGLASNGTICAPDDGTWTQVGSLQTQGTLAQATFYSARSTATAESYTFTFQTACSTTGTPLGATGTAIAVRYTGVNPITPIDTNTMGNPQYNAGTPGTGTSVAPGPVTPARTGDYVVALYGTNATSLSLSSSSCTGFHQGTGSATATGFCTDTSPTANTAYTPTAATANGSKPWATMTIALESASGGCGSGCEYGIEDPGGVGTDYGLAITAAQQALDNEASVRPSATKVIILLSDGDANQTDGGTTEYPCTYGITQAETAEKDGVIFYSIAYGSIYAAGQSCTDDSSSAAGPLHGLSAQCAMYLMADNTITNPTQFPSGDTSAMSTLCPSGTYMPSDPTHHFYNQATDASLEQVFQEVGDSLSTPRLISNDAD